MPLDRRQLLAAAAGGLVAARPRTPLFDPDTLFLTYAGDPTTSVRVQWVGPPGQVPDPTLFVAPLDGSEWSPVRTSTKPYPLTDLLVHRADLRGLLPGTEYQFVIGDRSPAYRFRTLPAKATDTFSFVSGGDCGTNRHTVANNRVAAAQDPHFAVVGGDLGYDNGRSARTSLRFLENWSATMTDTQGRLVPLVPAIGNHEVNGGYNQPRERAPFFFALFDGLYPERSFATLDVGDFLSLVLLDTGHVAPIGGEQANWLGRQLRAREDRPHLMVVNHVPAYPSFRPPEGAAEGAAEKPGTGEANRTHWVPLFERHRVDLVLEHHDHTFKKTHRLTGGLRDANGVLYLGDGSWGQLRVPKGSETRPYLRTVRDDYHLTLHRLEGERRFHLALGETGKVLDMTVSDQKRPRRRG